MKNSLQRIAPVPACLAAAIAAGCSTAGPGVNIFKDDSVPASEWLTPSAQSVAAASAAPALRQRGWEPSTAVVEAEGSPHFPLWWEDPFEDKGSTDGQYAWTYEEAIAAPYSVGRYLLNTMAWPISAVIDPPGATQVSDGRLSRQGLGYDHDAARVPSWSVSVPTSEPPATQPTESP